MPTLRLQRNPQYDYGYKQNADGNSLFVTRHAPCDRDTTSESEQPPASTRRTVTQHIRNRALGSQRSHHHRPAEPKRLHAPHGTPLLPRELRAPEPVGTPHTRGSQARAAAGLILAARATKKWYTVFPPTEKRLAPSGIHSRPACH